MALYLWGGWTVSHKTSERNISDGGPSSNVLAPRTSKRWGNAVVYVTRDENSARRIVKDFAPCNFFVKNTWGRALVRKEERVLKRLDGMPGVPGMPRRKGRYALCFTYIDGVTLHEAHRRNMELGVEYFRSLEMLVEAMHRRDVAHFDLHTKSNIMVARDGSPAIIDFQTALFTKHLPSCWKWLLFEIDFSGVYKHWQKMSPDTLPDDRHRRLKKIRSLRFLWPFHGYPIRKLRNRLRKKKKERA